ncbi:urate oxidase [Evansella sp. AB-P1]|uniref:factor-independent urate hydroxylase n=1 Tax=Evansella sp. AB-P1 TaxID=3037653 RepID=UPI00241E8685|nr:urate oxidase [Evansella sp. AB-P1]MDG5787905.1 urate oxidase [Evansella sp. AB-P1]
MKSNVLKNKTEIRRKMYYGKGDVFVYRTYAKPLAGIKEIPESNFKGRSNTIFGMDIKVALKGDAFLSSFSKGDNSLVIATDSMKNFILYHAGEYDGSTMEGFLHYVSESFIRKYKHIDGIVISGKQFSFEEVDVSYGNGFAPSDTVFRQGLLEHPSTSLEVFRTEGDDYEIIDQVSGVEGLRLIKVKGSSFYGYIKDEFTTLPESFDRPLFIYLDIRWRYENNQDGNGENPSNYVCAEQVVHIAQAVFHEKDSPSIQKLIYDIGARILKRFPQLVEVSFESNNRTWDTVLDEVSSSPEGKVFTDPRPPYGFQGFSMTQDDILKIDED